MSVWYVAHPLSGDVPRNYARAHRWLRWLMAMEPGEAFALAWAPMCKLVLDGNEVADGRLSGQSYEDRCLRDDVEMVRSIGRVVLVGGRVSNGMAQERDAARAVGGIISDLTGLGDEPPEDLVISDPLALGVSRANESTDGTQVEPIMQFFTFDHLPPKLREASEPFAMLARRVVASTPRNAERSVALRKLLEAKDAAVRAALAK